MSNKHDRNINWDSQQRNACLNYCCHRQNRTDWNTKTLNFINHRPQTRWTDIKCSKSVLLHPMALHDSANSARDPVKSRPDKIVANSSGFRIESTSIHQFYVKWNFTVKILQFHMNGDSLSLINNTFSSINRKQAKASSFTVVSFDLNRICEKDQLAEEICPFLITFYKFWWIREEFCLDHKTIRIFSLLSAGILLLQ